MGTPGRLRVVATALLTAVLCSVATIFAGFAVPASAQTVPNQPQVEVPHIIPRPNSGQAPKSATDRGGWAQYAVFWGICAAMLIMIGLVVLESRRKLRVRAAIEASAQSQDGQSRASTLNEPVAETSENSPDSIARQ